MSETSNIDVNSIDILDITSPFNNTNFGDNFEDMVKKIDDNFKNLSTKGGIYCGSMGSTPNLVNVDIFESNGGIYSLTTTGVDLLNVIFRNEDTYAINSSYTILYNDSTNSVVYDWDSAKSIINAEYLPVEGVYVTDFFEISGNPSCMWPMWEYSNDIDEVKYTPVSPFVFFDKRTEYLSSSDGLFLSDDGTSTSEFTDTGCVVMGYLDTENDKISLEKYYLYPTLYYDSNVQIDGNSESGAWCWNLNGQKTGIAAEGIQGKDAEGRIHLVIETTNNYGSTIYKYFYNGTWMESVEYQLSVSIDDGDIGWLFESADNTDYNSYNAISNSIFIVQWSSDLNKWSKTGGSDMDDTSITYNSDFFNYIWAPIAKTWTCSINAYDMYNSNCTEGNYIYEYDGEFNWFEVPDAEGDDKDPSFGVSDNGSNINCFIRVYKNDTTLIQTYQVGIVNDGESISYTLTVYDGDITSDDIIKDIIYGELYLIGIISTSNYNKFDDDYTKDYITYFRFNGVTFDNESSTSTGVVDPIIITPDDVLTYDDTEYYMIKDSDGNNIYYYWSKDDYTIDGVTIDVGEWVLLKDEEYELRIDNNLDIYDSNGSGDTSVGIVNFTFSDETDVSILPDFSLLYNGGASSLMYYYDTEKQWYYYSSTPDGQYSLDSLSWYDLDTGNKEYSIRNVVDWDRSELTVETDMASYSNGRKHILNFKNFDTIELNTEDKNIIISDLFNIYDCSLTKYEDIQSLLNGTEYTSYSSVYLSNNNYDNLNYKYLTYSQTEDMDYPIHIECNPIIVYDVENTGPGYLYSNSQAIINNLNLYVVDEGTLFNSISKLTNINISSSSLVYINDVSYANNITIDLTEVYNNNSVSEDLSGLSDHSIFQNIDMMENCCIYVDEETANQLYGPSNFNKLFNKCYDSKGLITYERYNANDTTCMIFVKMGDTAYPLFTYNISILSNTKKYDGECTLLDKDYNVLGSSSGDSANASYYTMRCDEFNFGATTNGNIIKYITNIEFPTSFLDYGYDAYIESNIYYNYKEWFNNWYNLRQVDNIYLHSPFDASSMFQNCIYLESITIKLHNNYSNKDNTTTGIFKNCIHLHTVTLPENFISSDISNNLYRTLLLEIDNESTYNGDFTYTGSKYKIPSQCIDYTGDINTYDKDSVFYIETNQDASNVDIFNNKYNNTESIYVEQCYFSGSTSSSTSTDTFTTSDHIFFKLTDAHTDIVTTLKDMGEGATEYVERIVMPYDWKSEDKVSIDTKEIVIGGNMIVPDWNTIESIKNGAAYDTYTYLTHDFSEALSGFSDLESLVLHPYSPYELPICYCQRTFWGCYYINRDDIPLYLNNPYRTFSPSAVDYRLDDCEFGWFIGTKN